MRWCLLDRHHVILAECDAQTKLGAVAKLKPKEGEIVTSLASYRIGYPPKVARALRKEGERCVMCRRTTGHQPWCRESYVTR